MRNIYILYYIQCVCKENEVNTLYEVQGFIMDEVDSDFVSIYVNFVKD